MFHPGTTEHFYTSGINERNTLRKIGWIYEGIGWYAPATGDPVYRLFNPRTGDHHYTTTAHERDVLSGIGWIYEGIGWYSDPDKGMPMYRQCNPHAVVGAHNYSCSTHERDVLVTRGWVDEGIGFYGLDNEMVKLTGQEVRP
jgi:predicted nucleic acid-binding Zn ribbon protein